MRQILLITTVMLFLAVSVTKAQFGDLINKAKDKAIEEALKKDKEDMQKRLDNYEKRFGKEKKEIPLPPKPTRAGEKPIKKLEVIKVRL